jgi:hypothetical protein
MGSGDNPDDLLEGLGNMKGVDVETKGNVTTNVNAHSIRENIEVKGNVSTDLNTYSFKVEVEVPGKKVLS